MPKGKIKIGVSACLIGEKVRYDSEHKKDLYITDVLSSKFEFIPVCPEVEVGLGVPREAMRLVTVGREHHLMTIKSKVDLTEKIQNFSKKKAAELIKLQLRGYIFKKNSPSCGMERVKVYSGKGVPHAVGAGLFAKAVMEGSPCLPVEEEGRLQDQELRQNWVERVLAYTELMELLESQWKLKDLIAFHTRYKLVLLAHDEAMYRTLGRKVGQAKAVNQKEFAVEYERTFMAALTKLATVKKHINVLQHVLGYLRPHLDTRTKADLIRALELYRKGSYPLAVPLVMISHYLKKHDVAYLNGQAYFRNIEELAELSPFL